MSLKEGIDERGQCRPAGEKYKDTEEEQGDYHRQQPEFFSGLKESPDIVDEIHVILQSSAVSKAVPGLQADGGGAVE